MRLPCPAARITTDKGIAVALPDPALLDLALPGFFFPLAFVT
jgi:hypothetical protein